MNSIVIRYAMVFREDGLDLEGLKETLSKYGSIFDIEDNLFGDEPVKIIYIETSLGDSIRLILDFNCVEAEDNKYVLFPMESALAKQKVLQSR